MLKKWRCVKCMDLNCAFLETKSTLYACGNRDNMKKGKILSIKLLKEKVKKGKQTKQSFFYSFLFYFLKAIWKWKTTKNANVSKKYVLGDAKSRQWNKYLNLCKIVLTPAIFVTHLRSFVCTIMRPQKCKKNAKYEVYAVNWDKDYFNDLQCVVLRWFQCSFKSTAAQPTLLPPLFCASSKVSLTNKTWKD